MAYQEPPEPPDLTDAELGSLILGGPRSERRNFAHLCSLMKNLNWAELQAFLRITARLLRSGGLVSGLVLGTLLLGQRRTRELRRLAYRLAGEKEREE
jgi:hypothetical protein